jgi:hypothetical protein
MGKRGRCCGCFPNLVNLIVDTSEAYHREICEDEEKVVMFINELKKKHEQCETARALALARKVRTKVA